MIPSSPPGRPESRIGAGADAGAGGSGPRVAEGDAVEAIGSDPSDRRPTGSVRTRGRPSCPLCGSNGTVEHADLADRFFGAPGRWSIRRCPRASCGLRWLDPAPVPEDLGLVYAHYYTHDEPLVDPPGFLGAIRRRAKAGYLSRRFDYRSDRPALDRMSALLLLPFLTRRENLDQLVMHLGARRGGRVLDVGCGRGRTVRALGELGWRAEGIDPDPAAIEAAQRAGLKVTLGSLETVPYADASFDAVVSSHVIEHVFDPVAFLRGGWRLLAPGGTLVVVTPNGGSLGHRVLGDRWHGLEIPRHLSVFDRASLGSAARAAGIPELSIRTSARMAAFMHQVATRGWGMRAGMRDVAFQLRERWRMRRLPDEGEELILVARRSGREP